MRRERDKLNKSLGGIREMSRTPAAVWIVDTNKEHLAVEEARKLKIPIIGILDSNCDPDLVDFPIPGNDDAIRAVGLLTRVVADAVAEGLIARSGVKAGTDGAEAVGAEEPLAEWERELLGGDAEQAAEAATSAPTDATEAASEATGASTETVEAIERVEEAALAADAAEEPAAEEPAAAEPAAEEPAVEEPVVETEVTEDLSESIGDSVAPEAAGDAAEAAAEAAPAVEAAELEITEEA